MNQGPASRYWTEKREKLSIKKARARTRGIPPLVAAERLARGRLSHIRARRNDKQGGQGYVATYEESFGIEVTVGGETPPYEWLGYICYSERVTNQPVT